MCRQRIRDKDTLGFTFLIQFFAECGGEIEGTEGVLRSPGYPNSFAHRHSCTWTIRAPPGRKVTLTFDDFDLEQPRTLYNNETYCQYDSIMVCTIFILYEM